MINRISPKHARKKANQLTTHTLCNLTTQKAMPTPATICTGFFSPFSTYTPWED